jgi:nucleotide-binding universal stress UspA family protein
MTRSPRIVRLKPGLLPSEKAFRRILVAVDGSESSFRAAKYAVMLAKRNEAELIVVSVVHKPARPFMPTPLEHRSDTRLDRYYAYASKNAEHLINRVVESARNLEVNVRTRVLRDTSIVKAITEYAASQEVDLIVVGRKGTSGFKRLLLGSVSNGVVNHAVSTVLVVR